MPKEVEGAVIDAADEVGGIAKLLEFSRRVVG